MGNLSHPRRTGASGGCKMDSLDSVIKALEDVQHMAPNGEDYWMARDSR